MPLLSLPRPDPTRSFCLTPPRLSPLQKKAPKKAAKKAPKKAKKGESGRPGSGVSWY